VTWVIWQEEHEVLAVSYQEVRSQLEQVRRQHGLEEDAPAQTPSLRMLHREVDDHRARLFDLVRARAEASGIPAPQPDASGQVSLSELLAHVEQCTASEKDLAARVFAVESENAAVREENQDLMDEQEALVLQYKKLQDEQDELQERHAALQAEYTKAVGTPAPGALPREVDEVRVELVLGMEMEEVGPEDEPAFCQAVAQDVAAAVGGDVSKVRVLGLQPGSIRVHLALDEGVCGEGVAAVDVANDIKAQAHDAGSQLKQGRFTSSATAATVSVVKVPTGNYADITRPSPTSLYITGQGRHKLEQATPPEQRSAPDQDGAVINTAGGGPRVKLGQTAPAAPAVVERARGSSRLGQAPSGAEEASDASKAEHESKQQAFTEEIARLSAVAEQRRCELLDQQQRIATLEGDVIAQQKRSQKATADMYAEMHRMQAQMDAKDAEMREVLAQLEQAQAGAQALEERANMEKVELQSRAAGLEKKLQDSEYDRATLSARLEALNSETSDFYSKLEGNAEASRLMDENRLHEIARLQGELEQAHLDKAAVKAALIEAETSLSTHTQLSTERSTQLEGLQAALQAEQKAHAEAVAQVYALQTEGVSKVEDQAMVGEMAGQLRDATSQRDELAMRCEDLARQLSGTTRPPPRAAPPLPPRNPAKGCRKRAVALSCKPAVYRRIALISISQTRRISPYSAHQWRPYT
jgi:hypothetical protein